MKRRDIPSQGAPSGRRIAGRAQDDHLIDPYKLVRKLKEPAACPQCGAVYQGGRWSWAERPAAAHDAVCQACHRINDRYPAGTLVLRGAAAGEHRAELLSLARHQETAEKAEHPMNRIMEIRETPEAIVIATTDIHLPRRIGEAVRRAFHGELKTHFDEDTYSVRAEWSKA